MCKLSSSSNEESSIFWKVGEELPSEFSQVDPIASTLIPRTTAWISVDNDSVSILNGFTAAAYTPPNLFFAASSLPSSVIRALLKESKVCTLSAVTTRDPETALAKTAASSLKNLFRFNELGLPQAKPRDSLYPCAVSSSPIHMYCSLDQVVPLDSDEMIILTVESFVVDGSVLSDPTQAMKDRNITAKIDANLIQPLVSLGNGNFQPLKELRSMPRPKQQEDGTWTSDSFDTPVAPSLKMTEHSTMEWNFREHGRSCPLGFNPTTALIAPRPIGWISTYSKNDRIPHLAPYSFFIDVARGEHPMVAFSAFRKKDGTVCKDAQKDAQETGCFCFNLVTEPLAVQMNYSAAELPREESEFELAGLQPGKARLVDAPVVAEAPVRYECEYVKTVNVDSFSIVIGRVKGVLIDKAVVKDGGGLDVSKLLPIVRLGYMDEYGTVA